MNAEQRRLSDALDRLDITHAQLIGLTWALEHLLDDFPAMVTDDHPAPGAIAARRARG